MGKKEGESNSRQARQANDDASEPRPDIQQFLTWWRLHSPFQISELVDDFGNLLVTCTRGLIPDELLNKTLLGDKERADTALAIASQLAERGATSDLVMSWIVLGGASGNRLASRMMFDALSAQAAEYSTEVEPEIALHQIGLAADWYLTIGHAWKRGTLVLLEESGREAFRNQSIELAKSGTGKDPGADRADARSIIDDAGSASLIVVEKIGDTTGREGREAVTRYAGLTRSMPLAGDRTDPELLGRVLHLEFPWFEAPIEAVVSDLRLRRIAGVPWNRFRPLLLVGPPGVGKTRFAKRLGRLAGTGCEVISAAGASDNRMLAGTARGWASGQPAFPLLAMVRTRTANPILVVDEIDKVSSGGHNGDLRATLLAMLEPQTAAMWPDEYLLAPCNLSQVSWILTANEVRGLPEPLLSRVRVVHVEGPEPHHFEIVLHAVLRDLAEELSVPTSLLPGLERESVDRLRQCFVRERSVRRLKAAVTAALSCSASVTRTRFLN